MAFSSSFFTIEPNETDEEEVLEQLEQQQEKSASGVADKQGEQQSDQLPPPQQQEQSGSVLPPATDKQPLTETNTISNGADQLLSDDKSDMGNATKSAASSVPPKKKKGTATTIKAPKRSRPGSSGGKKKKSLKAGNATGPGSQNGDENAAAGGDEDSGSDQESDSGPYCLCRGPDNHRFMIACDKCQDWFHGECIGMDKFTGENLVQKYICPNCSDGKRYVTRYKKMCSLEGCEQPARLYDEKPSIFCSQEHCQAWWERLIATLPKGKIASLDNLTRNEFLGLLDPRPRTPGDRQSNWRLGDEPFGVEDNFWETVDPSVALTQEESDLIEKCATERFRLSQEMVLRKKMLQLLEMGLKQREAAIASGTLTKDVCGYDTRLNTVGVVHQFAAFISSPEGEAIFEAGRLESPLSSEQPAGTTTAGTMCIKKKCRPHNGWGAILAKNVKHSIKELTVQAQEHVHTETRIRNNAAGRFRRKQLEGNTVRVFDSPDDEVYGDDGAVKDVEMG
ncbi:Set1 complex component spp1 [Naviculisporaceae sp. PSN 640]